MIDAVPPPPIIVVERSADHAPTFFLGFMAVGEEEAMTSLEAAAKQAGFPFGRTKNHKDQTEVMVLFPPHSDRTRALSLYRDALAGKFGSMALEVTIAPESAASVGKLDPDTEISVEPPNFIVAKTP